MESDTFYGDFMVKLTRRLYGNLILYETPDNFLINSTAISLSILSPHCLHANSISVSLVSCLHIKVRLMGNLGLNGVIPCLCNTNEAIFFLCKVDIETDSHFLFDCPNFRKHFDLLWANLTVKVTKFMDIDGTQISEFIAELS